MPAYGYEFYLLVFNSISHSFTALTREISSRPLKDKIHIHARACNILYLIHWYLADFNAECRTHYRIVILKLRVIRYWVESGSSNGMASPTNMREFFMFKVKFITANSQNFFKCELPVFVCQTTLVSFLRIYKDTGSYFSLTDRTNAFHFLCRSFCVYFQIKLKKRLKYL